MTVFETKVTGIGPEAELFKEEKMVILFGDEAPEALANYCYNIELQQSQEQIVPGMVLGFDDQVFQITAVGGVVQENLDKLGHITIRFDGADTAELPGTLYVEDKEMPEINVGTAVTIK